MALTYLKAITQLYTITILFEMKPTLPVVQPTFLPRSLSREDRNCASADQNVMGKR